MNPLGPPPHPLLVRLCNTERCKLIARELCEFENHVFGPDFACSPESVKDWFDSGCLFCATMCGEAVAGRERVLSAISALLTNEDSRDRLLRGEISDSELVPWSRCSPTSRPSIYFASVISDNPAHLSSMYQSVGGDIEAYLAQFQLEPISAFAIASGEAGQGHMSRNGFKPHGSSYLSKYTMMTLDFTTATTLFWRRLLGPMALRARSVGTLVHEHDSAPTGVPEDTILGGDRHEVERRLAQSKTDRYRRIKSSY